MIVACCYQKDVLILEIGGDLRNIENSGHLKSLPQLYGGVELLREISQSLGLDSILKELDHT